MAKGVLDRLLTLRAALIVVALLVASIIALGPRVPAGDTAPPLTTYSTGPYGARGLWQVLQRLGWHTERRLVPISEPLDTAAVYAVLDPPLRLTTNEVHTLLDAVRRGAGAIVVPTPHSALADSLHIEQSSPSFVPYVIVDSAQSVTDTADTTEDEADAAAHAHSGALRTLSHYLTLTAPLPEGAVTFVAVHGRKDGVRPAILGVPLGRGRLVVVADASVFRNAVVRAGDAAVLDTRLIEWLAPAQRRPLVFDEYHHGYGDHGSMTRAVRHAMLGTPAGRMLTQGIVAALALLVVLGMRALPPSPRSRIERRSPMEHVGALARAYEQVGATRTVSRRLLRGLRRRHPFGARHSDEDEVFLDALRARYPSLASDLELLRRAIRQSLTPEELLGVGHAIHHIERTMIS